LWIGDDVSGRVVFLLEQDGDVDQEVGKQPYRGRKIWINPSNTPLPIEKNPD